MKIVFHTIAIFFIALSFAVLTFAQKTDYKPGEKIEYKVSDYSDVWEEGVYVKPGYNGTQPIIRRKPTQYFPEGDEVAWQWDKIRPLGAKTTAKTETKPQETDNKPAAKTNDFGGSGLMTKEEVYKYAAQASAQAANEREQFCQQIISEIKRRGVNFRIDATKGFPAELNQSKCESGGQYLYYAVQYNYGAPPTLDWLEGAWKMEQQGATVDFNGGDGYVYRQNEMAAKVGVLKINADKTYQWKLYPNDPPAKYVKGTWREATAAELKYRGGHGIVLEKAKDGYNWLVVEWDLEAHKGDWIDVQYMGGDGFMRQYGSRMGKSK